jgi:hypothetical protein
MVRSIDITFKKFANDKAGALPALKLGNIVATEVSHYD